SSSPSSAATSHGLCGLASHIAVGAEPAPPSRKSACDFQLRTGSLGWRLEKPRSDPDSVSLHRARWLSILSMPRASGSSCIGNWLRLQAHLALEETRHILTRNPRDIISICVLLLISDQQPHGRTPCQQT